MLLSKFNSSYAFSKSLTNLNKLIFSLFLILNAVLNISAFETPSIAIGYCIAKNIPNLATSSVVNLSKSLSLNSILPVNTL